MPFEIPDNWTWVRHNSIFEIFGGSQPPKDKFISFPKEGYIRLYQIRDYGPNPEPVYIPIKDAHKTTKKDDILLARYGASVGKVFFAEPGAYNVAMAKVEKLYEGNHIDKLYLYLFYKSDLYQSLVLNNSRSAQAGFNKEDLNDLLIPIPSFKEQQRIVNRINDFNPLLNDYELAESKLTLLEQDFPEQLKKSILQYAIEGKLVKQDPNDEPASVLLERIKTEKEKLIKEGKIKRDKNESTIYQGDDKNYYEKVGNIEELIETPFEINDQWSWTRLKDISIIQEGAGIRTFQYKESGIQLLTVTNILEGKVDLFKSKKYVSVEEFNQKYLHLQLNKGDIVSSCSGASWGKTAIFNENDIVMLNTSTLRLRFYNDSADNMYLYYLTKTPLFKKQLVNQLSGMQPNFGYAHYSKLLVPLPSLNTQHKIVELLTRILIQI